MVAMVIVDSDDGTDYDGNDFINEENYYHYHGSNRIMFLHEVGY